MAKKNQHVVPLGNGWAVKGEGSKKLTAITDTQKDAITIARGIAKNNKSELVIHGKNGKIRDKDTFGNDTNPPKIKNIRSLSIVASSLPNACGRT